MFHKLLLTTSLLFSLSNAAGTYDGYVFDDTQEKYSIHFLNTALSTDITGLGLSSTDATAIRSLRPITSLSTVASNSNITGKDMLQIREHSAAITIPDQSPFSEYNEQLGLTANQINFIFALAGLFTGMVFFFFSIKFVSGRI